MKIVIDQVHDSVNGQLIGVMFVDTDPMHVPPPNHPTLPRIATDWIEWLVAMNTFTPAQRAANGWGVINQLPGEVAPLTRWARLVAAANAAGADAVVKALGLSGS